MPLLFVLFKVFLAVNAQPVGQAHKGKNNKSQKNPIRNAKRLVPLAFIKIGVLRTEGKLTLALHGYHMGVTSAWIIVI